METSNDAHASDWTGTPARHAAAFTLALAGAFGVASSWSGSVTRETAVAADVGGGAGGSAPTSTIDLNAATQPELESLPGIGPALAARIIEHREKHGAFTSVDELDKVRGIGPVTLENIRRHVSVR